MRVQPDEQGATQPRGWRALAARPGSLIALALGVLLLVAVLVWNQGAERRALQRMPEDERAEFYAHSLTDLQTLCDDPRRPALLRECRRRARFLLKFPECEGECRALAEEQLGR